MIKKIKAVTKPAKLNTITAALVYTEDQPVAVYWGVDENEAPYYYAGTVTTIADNEITVELNDGSVEVLPKEDWKLVIPMTKKLKTDEPLTKADVAKLFDRVASEAKPADKKQVEKKLRQKVIKLGDIVAKLKKLEGVKHAKARYEYIHNQLSSEELTTLYNKVQGKELPLITLTDRPQSDLSDDELKKDGADRQTLARIKEELLDHFSVQDSKVKTSEAPPSMMEDAPLVNPLTNVALKKGNIQIVTPLDFIKDPEWKSYQIVHPNFPKDGYIDGALITISKGKIIGMTPKLAEQLKIETVGEKQGLTLKEEKQIKVQQEKEKFAEDFKKSPMALAVRLMAIQDSYSAGKISKGQAEQRIEEVREEFINQVGRPPKQFVPTGPIKVVDEVRGYSISAQEGTNGLETKSVFSLQSQENLEKGIESGPGDTYHQTLEDAQAAAQQQADAHAAAVERHGWLKAEELKKAEDADKAKKERAELRGFADNFSQIALERTRTHLNKRLSNGLTLKGFIEDLIDKKGYRVETTTEVDRQAQQDDQFELMELLNNFMKQDQMAIRKQRDKIAKRGDYMTTTRRLKLKGGDTFYTEKALSKIGMDYADFLSKSA